MTQKSALTQYLGIILGVLYGLALRLLGDGSLFENYFNIYSISFIWITPLIISLFPILFASNEIYKSKAKLFFYPIITIILFLACALMIRIEDLICIIILGLPFLAVAGLVGIWLGAFVKERIKNKKVLTIILIPLIFSPIENLFPNKTTAYNIASTIEIDLPKEQIFPNLLNVPTLNDSDYPKGIYQTLGIPRPIESKVYNSKNETYRIGTFTDNLKLYETISELQPNEFVNFEIDIKKSTLRNTPTDQHILKSKYFKFENISYTLKSTNNNKTKVILNCEYTINSKMNAYANFWASSIIGDFEKRLLDAIKHKLESN